MATIDKRPLKAYVRFDGSGRIVPSSLILRRKKPKVGKWIEIPAYECCEPVYTSTTTTTTTAAVTSCDWFEINVITSGTIYGVDCTGGLYGEVLDEPSITTRCARSLEATGDIIITNLGPCLK